MAEPREPDDPRPADAQDAQDAPDQGWSWRIEVPLVGPVGWPPTGSLAFLAVIGGLAAVEALSWPLALAVAVGHVLARDHDHRVLREIGEGLENA